eukprot:5534-Heterococcus_DN1.PRE.3
MATAVEDKIERDTALLADLTCPICKLCLKDSDLKDRRRSLKQHIARKNDAEHRLWLDMFWAIHFVKNGHKLRPRQYTAAEVQGIVHDYFGCLQRCLKVSAKKYKHTGIGMNATYVATDRAKANGVHAHHCYNIGVSARIPHIYCGERRIGLSSLSMGVIDQMKN